MKPSMGLMTVVSILCTVCTVGAVTAADFKAEQAVWPTTGTTTPTPSASTFGPRRLKSGNYRYDFHRGIDIPCVLGDPVYASVDGVVIKAGITTGYDDPLVQLEHTTSSGVYYTNYMHMDSVAVNISDVVAKATYLGECGASFSGFEHVHFEVREGGKNQQNCIHPLSLLPWHDPIVEGPFTFAIESATDIAQGRYNITVLTQMTNRQLYLKRIDVGLVGVAMKAPVQVAGRDVEPTFFDMHTANFQYTHKKSEWPAADCHYATEHPNGSDYDAHIHLDKGEGSAGVFNGQTILPYKFVSGSTDYQLRVSITVEAADVNTAPLASELCIEASATSVEFPYLAAPNDFMQETDMFGKCTPAPPTAEPTSAPPTAEPTLAPPTPAPPATFTIDVPVHHSHDDCEEDDSTGDVSFGSSDLELGHDGDPQTVGIRWREVNIPAGSTIVEAKIVFVADESNSGTAPVVDVLFDAAGDSQSYKVDKPSTRTTTASVQWTISEVWTTGLTYETPDLSAALQEVVDGAGWHEGNTVGCLIRVAIGCPAGAKRTAEPFGDDGPVLHVVYAPSNVVTKRVRVGYSLDDVEQRTWSTFETSVDLELAHDNGQDQAVGLRFRSLGVPQGANIVYAGVTFVADRDETGDSPSLTIHGDSADSSAQWSLANLPNDRTPTAAVVNWTGLPAWHRRGGYATPDLTAIVVELTSRLGWTTDSHLSLIIKKNPSQAPADALRAAESFDSSTPDEAPVLTISYTV
eukprot:TRINITY_DN1421_c1_g1_i1.p1 TRINITY_DN1421_c1_g1~~TRINITY_DN1421_c1_g1_i1.p1  ORF type:complete len:746 (+),score=206.59 TRINITY_DN1421_c1_g1_i1:80-2317(+)